jgi:exodeoxyribonuclease VII small subunit
MTDKEKNVDEILAELEAVVAEVENGVMPLEKMVDRISCAAKLIQQCRKKLNDMNAKVELMFKDDGGQGEFTEFDPASERSKAAGKVRKSPAKNEDNAGDIQDDLPF